MSTDNHIFRVKAKAEKFILHYIMVAHSLILFLTFFFTGTNAFWLEFVELVYRHFVSLEKNESFRPNGDGTTIFLWLILATRKSSRV